jgi:hypothetical protein
MSIHMTTLNHDTIQRGEKWDNTPGLMYHGQRHMGTSITNSSIAVPNHTVENGYYVGLAEVPLRIIRPQCSDNNDQHTRPETHSNHATIGLSDFIYQHCLLLRITRCEPEDVGLEAPL